MISAKTALEICHEELKRWTNVWKGARLVGDRRMESIASRKIKEAEDAIIEWESHPAISEEEARTLHADPMAEPPSGWRWEYPNDDPRPRDAISRFSVCMEGTGAGEVQLELTIDEGEGCGPRCVSTTIDFGALAWLMEQEGWVIKPPE